MAKLKPLPEYINGYKVIEDLGTIEMGNKRLLIAQCKNCSRHFETHRESIRQSSRKGCGCTVYSGLGFPIRLQRTYKSMLARCHDDSQKNYSSYGGKGISVYAPWISDRFNFFNWAMQNGYMDNLTIDRISPELGYFPENCRWITMQEQIQRRRTVTKLTPDLIRSIRKDLLTMKNIEVSKKYGIHKVHVSGIKTGKYWSNIE